MEKLFVVKVSEDCGNTFRTVATGVTLAVRDAEIARWSGEFGDRPEFALTETQGGDVEGYADFNQRYRLSINFIRPARRY